MKQERKRRRIVYKRAVLTNNHATVQQLLTQALAQGEGVCAGGRQEPLGENTGVFRLINRHTPGNGMIFGQFMQFEAGRAQQLITIEDDAEFYSMKELSPSEMKTEEELAAAEDQRKEFVESIMYFGIKDNHVVLMTSAALRPGDFESHLGWLLGYKTEVMDANSALILQDKPSQEVIDKVMRGDVKCVKVGSDIRTMAMVKEEQGEQIQTQYVPTGRGSSILSAIIGDNWVEQLNLDDTLDDANLTVDLQIKYRRKTSKNGQKVLDDVATSLRNMEDGDFKIEMKDGGEFLSGDDLRLSKHINVNTINGSIIESDLYHEMYVWLFNKIQVGDVEAQD
ncbi:hypothetical protein [Pseudohalioglobus lutimaris]|uniref:Uncharacterized protein n=1 Tax=Pseudohalioglobus lutimaris TaxID=1737061 RepID=A0A2N5X0Y4_9GAMM|nr:hypothetical protein [Pseudohalioglobus lutimaris]PLW68163.1 hypothetical protein C0039_13285 [Pseudohalioglobus lutimaris]